MVDGHQRFGMIATMSLRLLYLAFQHVLGLLTLLGRTSTTNLDHSRGLQGRTRIGVW